MANKFVREVTLTVKPGQRFGFDLSAAKPNEDTHGTGQYICGVDPGSPASLAALLKGDYLVKVNNDLVTNKNHAQVVELIKSSGSTLRLTVESSAVVQMHRDVVMIKVRGKLCKRVYRLSEDNMRVLWKSKHKPKSESMFRVGDVKEIRLGRQSHAFEYFYNTASPRIKEALGGEQALFCFSVVVGEDYEVIDLVAPNEPLFNAWTIGLEFLSGKCQKEMLTPVGVDVERDAWLREIFERGDVNHDNELTLSEVRVLLKKLNLDLPENDLRRIFYESDQDKGKKDKGHNLLNFQEFKVFYKTLASRPELGALMLQYGRGKVERTAQSMTIRDTFDDVTMNADQLLSFLKVEQHAEVTRNDCVTFIQDYEPNQNLRSANLLSLDGFTRFLLGEHGEAFNPTHQREVYQDMTQPMTHYFIASSHNTYLTEDQLRGPSDVEAYIRAMLMGCRCVELDCWDGDEGEPVIYHGHTLTSKISFKDVIQAVHTYAFVTSDYPFILSLENHCSIPQQKKMAQYMLEILGDAIHTDFDEKLPDYPSPEQLKRRILIKGKRLKHQPSSLDEDGDVSDEDESSEALNDADALKKQPKSVVKAVKAAKAKSAAPAGAVNSAVSAGAATSAPAAAAAPAKKQKLSVELSNLITLLQSVHFKGFDTDPKTLPYYQMSSFGETKARKFATDVELGKKFLQRNIRQLARTYPAGFRVTSTNYDPQEMWNAGCQIVALNYQTHCHDMNVNQGKFRDNGGCGYILKPAEMRSFEANFDPNDPMSFNVRNARTLTIKIISGQRFPKPDITGKGEIVDPYVVVDILGVPTDTQSDRTRTVNNNGFNPVWNETLDFDLAFPEHCLVHFKVYDEDAVSGDDFLAQAVVPLHSLRDGYRHVRLRAKSELPLRNCSLFIQVTLSTIGLSRKMKASQGIRMPPPKLSADAKCGIPTLDSTYATIPVANTEELQESMLQNLEAFKSFLGLNVNVHENSAVQALRSRVEQLGGKLLLQQTPAKGGRLTFSLAQQISHDKLNDKTVDRPLRAYEILRGSIENVYAQYDDLDKQLVAATKTFEQNLVDRRFEELLDQNRIKKESARKEAREVATKQLAVIRDVRRHWETTLFNCQEIMATVRTVLA